MKWLILKYFRKKNATTHLLCKLWNADDLDLNHNGPIIFIHRKYVSIRKNAEEEPNQQRYSLYQLPQGAPLSYLLF